MFEHGLNYEDSTVKEITDFFETRMGNLKPKEKILLFPKSKKPKRKNEKSKWDDSNLGDFRV